MTPLEMLMLLIVAGIVLYFVSLLPLDAAILRIIRALVILIVVLYAIDFVLHLTGVGHKGLRLHF